MLVHLEHADAILAPKDRLQRGVSHDFPFVLRVLQVVLADVVPHLRNDLAARKRSASGNLRQIRRRLNRASQSAPCFTCALCHYGPPVVPLLIERNLRAFAMALWAERSVLNRAERHDAVAGVVPDVRAAAVGNVRTAAPFL